MNPTPNPSSPAQPGLSVRQNSIIDIAKSAGSVDVDTLAAHFLVTPQTIRRDLRILCGNAHLTRTHGGAVFTGADAHLSYAARRHLAADAKRHIGELAAGLVPQGSSLFINIGTTTEQVARCLKAKRELMVITNNVNVVNILLGAAGIELIVAGGVVRHEDSGIVGERASDFLSQFRVDYAIIGASAIGADGTLLDHDYREVLAARAIIGHARSVILVADASKFRRSAPIRIAGIAGIRHFVTDRAPPAACAAACAAGGVEIHTPDARS